MPYIGNTAADRFVASKAASVFSGDGSTTAFTLSYGVGSDEDILVSVDGVIQEPSVAYSVSGTTLTFTAAPSSNAGNNIFVYYLFRTVGTVSHPSSNALEATSGTFSDDLTVDTDTLHVDSTNNRVGIGTASPTTALTLGASHTVTVQNGGSNSAPAYAITSGSLGTNGITAPSANTLGFVTASTERMQITSSGNVDLPDSDGDVCGRFRASAGTNSVIIEADPASSAGSSSMQFRVDASEAYRINSSRELLLRTTVSENNSIMTINNASSQVVKNGITLCTSSTGTSFSHLLFKNPNGNVGSVTTNGSATAFNTSSDHRLKENVTADWDATTRLKQLNPVRFNFIADADTTVDGFLAHEVQSVVPEAISGTHNEVDDDGNPIYQGIDQSKLVPLLVKTIQELEARIVALENS